MPLCTGCLSLWHTVHFPSAQGVFALCTRCMSPLYRVYVPYAQGACRVCRVLVPSAHSSPAHSAQGTHPVRTWCLSPLHRTRAGLWRQISCMGLMQSQNWCLAQLLGVLHPTAGLPGWLCAQDTSALAPLGDTQSPQTTSAS